MVAINKDYAIHLQLDSLMERIIEDMPDDVAQVMFDDIHGNYDYE